MSTKLAPKYPIYIPSKGRWESRATARLLDKLALPFLMCVEPQEYDAYASVIDEQKLIKLPFSNLGQGSIPARNFIWEHAKARGAARHWIIDDNISELYRFNRNLKEVRVRTSSAFRAMEDFTDRYTNVPMAGPQYHSFTRRRETAPPFVINTRVYSCILLDTSMPHRWRGRYNEDTDLSLRFLKDGYCTILFNCFLIFKPVTMTMTGGNTDELYRQEQGFDGRLAMAQELLGQHPDVTKITRKFGRWQHHVDYRRFAGNQLRRRTDLDPALFARPINEYGMQLVERDSSTLDLMAAGAETDALDERSEQDGDEDETQAEAGAGASAGRASGAAPRHHDRPASQPDATASAVERGLVRDNARRS